MLNFLINSACLLGGVVCLAITGLLVSVVVEYTKAYMKDQK